MPGRNTGGECTLILYMLKSTVSFVEGNYIYLMNKLAFFIHFYHKQQFPHKYRGPRKDFAHLSTFHNDHKSGLTQMISRGPFLHKLLLFCEYRKHLLNVVG